MVRGRPHRWLAIPWGEAKGEMIKVVTTLVWTRDMVNSATALLAAGDTATPLRALIYLAVAQRQMVASHKTSRSMACLLERSSTG